MNGKRPQESETSTEAEELIEEEIERMRREAERHMEEDKKKRELVEAKNNAEILLYGAEKVLKEAKGKKKEKLREAMKRLEEVVGENDAKEIKKRSNDLSKILAEIAIEDQRLGIRK